MAYALEQTESGLRAAHAPCDACGDEGLWLLNGSPYSLERPAIICDACRFVPPAASPTARAAAFFGWLALVLVALTIWCSYAHASGADAAKAAAPRDVPTAYETPPPQPIHKGDAAPGDGVFLYPSRAALIAATCETSLEETDKLRAALQAKPSGWTTGSLLTAGALGVAVGAVLTAVVVAKLR